MWIGSVELFGEKVDEKSFVSQIALEKIFQPGYFFSMVAFQPFLRLFTCFLLFSLPSWAVFYESRAVKKNLRENFFC